MFHVPDRRWRWAAAALALGAVASAAALQPAAPDEPRRIGHIGHGGALDAALVRCQRLDEAALDDAACRAAWAEHRQRFLQIDALRGPRR